VSELHPGWSRTPFGRIFDRLQYGLTAKAVHAGTGIRFLRITDLNDGKVDWSSVPGFHADDDVERYVLRNGDFVFARSGSIEKAARIVDPPPSVFASYLIRGRLQNPEIADWLAYFIRSPNYLDQIRERAAGIGMSNVNASKLGSVEVPLPPLREQRQIVVKLDRLTGRTARAREELGRIPRLIQKYREAILAAAFRGELTCEWRQTHVPKRVDDDIGSMIRCERDA
jgi:type I restriction enzyme S subunit